MINLIPESSLSRFCMAISSVGILLLAIGAGTSVLLADRFRAEWDMELPRFLTTAVELGVSTIALALLGYFIVLAFVRGSAESHFGQVAVMVFLLGLGGYCSMVVLSFVGMLTNIMWSLSG